MEQTEHIQTYCIICMKPIPEERERKKAVTCSDECNVKKNLARRLRKDAKFCRICNKPSTHEQRVLFQRWMRETFSQPKTGRPKKEQPAPVNKITHESPAEGSDIMPCCGRLTIQVVGDGNSYITSDKSKVTCGSAKEQS